MEERNSPTWYQKDLEAWNTAAANLEANGYESQRDDYYPAVFYRQKDEMTVVLVRSLGELNWHPRAM